MMKCKWCKRHLEMLKCFKCNTMTCTHCIQLENHKCPSLAHVKDDYQAILQKKLVTVVAKKIDPI